MSQTFVKICGITTADAAGAVSESGADAIGFVFAPGSPRTISAEVARSLAAAVSPEIETVGVFRNQPLDAVLRIAAAADLTTVQLHGDEPESDFERLRREGFRTIRAVSIETYRGLAADSTDRLLIDAVSPGGGTLFDTSELESTPPQGFWILAGGLTAGNVRELVDGVRPGGVDVSSGVESSRGVKDLGLIRDFVQAARGL
ncbi:phosphoribosylanthranilate isomerase [Leifsonia sp. A12D58]|uniref:phosphoribosylanthranilate isomerase n=1 Tax=Leifsonia sp. A12D58 TaxID=3397674 RepID=UPI0039E0479F